MTIALAPLARCTTRGCPWRWRTGPDRPCAQHGGDDGGDVFAAAELLGIDLPPSGRHATRSDHASRDEPAAGR